MANDCIPFYEAAYTQKLTVNFTAAVTGKRFAAQFTARQSGPGLANTAEGGNYVCPGHAGAGANADGVVMYDVGAGGKGGVLRGPNTIVPLTSGAAIAVNDPIKSDANGKAIPQGGTGVILGYARSAVAGADLDVEVELAI